MIYSVSSGTLNFHSIEVIVGRPNVANKGTFTLCSDARVSMCIRAEWEWPLSRYLNVCYETKGPFKLRGSVEKF